MKSKVSIIIIAILSVLLLWSLANQYLSKPQPSDNQPVTIPVEVTDEVDIKPVIPSRPPTLQEEVVLKKFEPTSTFFQTHLPTIETPLDLQREPLNNKDVNTLPSSTPLEISTALYMLGYSFDKPNDPKLHLELLEKFQVKNDFPISSVLTEDVLNEMDNQLFAFEKKFEGYGQKFSPLFDHMTPDVPGSLFPKDYIAWIFTYPIEVLPLHLQMSSVDEMLNCIDIQCTGSILDEKGKMTHYGSFEITQVETGRKTVMKMDIDSLGQFQFKSDIFGPEIPKSSSSQVYVILHEYAHYLDSWGRKPMNDPNRPHFRMIDSIEFYNISTDNRDGMAIKGDGVTCFPLKTGPEGFLTHYGYDNRPSQEGECPPNSSAGRLEDFADSFTFYVTAGKHFRKAAEQNDFIRRKYNWLKTKVFNGVEYDTELTHFNQLYTGCTDKDFPSATPGYISCDTDFVWDGELRIQ